MIKDHELLIKLWKDNVYHGCGSKSNIGILYSNNHYIDDVGMSDLDFFSSYLGFGIVFLGI